MILTAISSSPELLSIDKTISSTTTASNESSTSSEQILTSTITTPEESLLDQVEISYEARIRSELAQYAEYQMYAQSSLASQEKAIESLNQEDQAQPQEQLIVAFPGVNLLV